MNFTENILHNSVHHSYHDQNATDTYFGYFATTWHYIIRHSAITKGDYAAFEDMEDVANTIMAFVCVLISGLAAGLIMGLLSLDVTKLEIKSIIGDDIEKEAASKLLPIVKQHHLLLVTLLFLSSMASESLPIFLSELMPGYVAVLFAVVLELLFGEILPTALFTGPNQLYIAVSMVNLVKFVMKMLYPVAYPISLLLDRWFGDEEKEAARLSRSEMHILISMQRQDRARGSNEYLCAQNLHNSEIDIMSQLLQLACISDQDEVCIRASEVYMLPIDMPLTKENLQAVGKAKIARIPVFKRINGVDPFDCIIGYVTATSLIGVDDSLCVGDLPLNSVVMISPDTALLRLLELFRATDSQIAVVSNKTSVRVDINEGHNLGIVTRSDLLKYICIDKQPNMRNTPKKKQLQSEVLKHESSHERDGNSYSSYQYSTPTPVSTGDVIEMKNNSTYTNLSEQSFISPVSKGFVFRNNRYMNRSHPNRIDSALNPDTCDETVPLLPT